MQQDNWSGDWPVHDGHCNRGAAGDNNWTQQEGGTSHGQTETVTAAALHAAGQVKEPGLLVCHTLTSLVACRQTAGHSPGAPHAAATGCLASPRLSPWLLPCRQNAAEKARMLLAAGHVKEAATAFSQAVTVTADMAHELVVQLQRLGIEFVVSPYEADSQLAFLSLVRPAAAVAPVLL